MTEREKIIEIIESNKLCVLDMDCNDCPYKDKLNKTYSCGSYKLADTLIEAGIGDVSAQKAEQEEIKLFNAKIKNGEIDMTVGSAGFKTFFALVEQIFKQNGATTFLTTTIEGGNDIKYAVTIQRVGEKSPAEELRQATELWKHEKHRAEVAERALRRKCESEADSTCPCDENSDKCKVCAEKRLCSTEYATQCYYEKAIHQAEREIEEEEER